MSLEGTVLVSNRQSNCNRGDRARTQHLGSFLPQVTTAYSGPVHDCEHRETQIDTLNSTNISHKKAHDPRSYILLMFEKVRVCCTQSFILQVSQESWSGGSGASAPTIRVVE